MKRTIGGRPRSRLALWGTSLALGGLLVGGLLFAAAGSSASSTAAAAPAKGSQGQVVTTPQPGYTAGLPTSIRALYAHSADILGPSAYRNWKPVATPWTLCFDNSYLGNTWRASALAVFNHWARYYQKLGLVKRYLTVTANLSLPTQIQQTRDLITVDHCSGIIAIPTGTSGMDGVLKEAYNAGIPVVGDIAPVTTPYYENFDENWYTATITEMHFLMNAIHGKGNILYVVGIPGETIDVEDMAAFNAVMRHYPHVHLVGKVIGQVTPSIAQSAVLQFLSTHPAPINAVFSGEGGMGSGIIAAFKQAGRPLPPLIFVGAGSVVSIFHNMLARGQHPNFLGLANSPGFTMKDSFRILIRILEGQHPKNMTIFYPPPEITPKNVNQWWTPNLTPSTTIWPAAPKEPLPTSLLNTFFINGHAALPYKGKG